MPFHVAAKDLHPTDFETESGTARVLDFMPPRSAQPDLVRIVVGMRGRVAMQMKCVVRFDYGSIVPWITRTSHVLYAVAGPDALQLRSPVPLESERESGATNFELSEGQRLPFVLTWHPSHLTAPTAIDPEAMLESTLAHWHAWAARCTYQGPWRAAVVRSLVTLMGLTYSPTGGIVAAATTSLPERWEGARNWDYRFCWLRDATFTLYWSIAPEHPYTVTRSYGRALHHRAAHRSMRLRRSAEGTASRRIRFCRSARRCGDRR
jgi:GH15 family glucan-1,4-alpha-glucosidase